WSRPASAATTTRQDAPRSRPAWSCWRCRSRLPTRNTSISRAAASWPTRWNSCWRTSRAPVPCTSACGSAPLMLDGWLAGIIVLFFHVVVAPFAILHALLYKRDYRSALGWIGISLLFPVAGPLLYFYLGV